MRAILGARAGVPLEKVPPVIPVDRLRELLGDLGAMPLAHRRGVPGLPPARADVFPAALATLAAIAELGGWASFTHSFYNLRYGLAADLLGID